MCMLEHVLEFSQIEFWILNFGFSFGRLRRNEVFSRTITMKKKKNTTAKNPKDFSDYILILFTFIGIFVIHSWAFFLFIWHFVETLNEL